MGTCSGGMGSAWGNMISVCSCVTDGVGDETRVFGGAGNSSADIMSELREIISIQAKKHCFFTPKWGKVRYLRGFLTSRMSQQRNGTLYEEFLHERMTANVFAGLHVRSYLTDLKDATKILIQSKTITRSLQVCLVQLLSQDTSGVTRCIWQ